MILGTAGHVDHGKSALVEALTGQGMDRLAEERARGITIDLNFAPLPLGTGEIASIVDVPGHEDLVRTMVAGAGGLDCALLVVAADEGVKPQTREHAAILAALGVPTGVVAVTKADLAEADHLATLTAELDRWLAPSSVRWAPSMAVSTRQGTGLEELRAAIEQAMRAAPRRDPLDAFRMPVDRAFSMPGTGTVVTGSVWTGAIEVGATVRLLPTGAEARVRTLEVHGLQRERVEAGTRAAIGLAGVERAEVGRGSEVVDLSLPWQPSSALDVELELTDEAPLQLSPRSRVQVLLGTSAAEARIVAQRSPEPGGRFHARLVLDRPIVARGGDRLVVRTHAPSTTIGGGGVLDPLPPRRRAPWPDGTDLADPRSRLLALLGRHGGVGTTPWLALRGGVSPVMVDRLLADDASLRRVEDEWVLCELVEGCAHEATAILERHHAEHPERPGMAQAELLAVAHRRSSVASAALGDLVAAGRIEVESGIARLSGHRARVAGGEEGAERVVQAVLDGGLTPPLLPELRLQFPGVDVPAAVRRGVATGRLRMVRTDWPFGGEALDGFVHILRGFGEREVSVAALRDRTGLSRKFLVPLLEWADRAGHSRRVGDVRHVT